MTAPAVPFLPPYSEVMEDFAVIGDALELGADDVYVTVASAGDNAFNGVLAGAARTIGVDNNADQIRLCQLKLDALRHLSQEQFAQLHGSRSASADERRALLGELDLAAYGFTADELDGVSATGLVDIGLLSAFVDILRAAISGVVGADALERLMHEPDEAVRVQLWDALPLDDLDATVESLVNEDTVAEVFVPAWAFDRMIETPFHRHLLRVVKRRIVTQDPRSNFFMFRMLLGRFPDENAVPEYLKPGRFAELQACADRVEFEHIDFTSCLSGLPGGSVSAFNVSNILDWCSDDDAAVLWAEVSRVARPGSRLFLRSFLRARDLPATAAGWHLDQDRSALYADLDRVGYYSRYERWVRP